MPSGDGDMFRIGDNTRVNLKKLERNSKMNCGFRGLACLFYHRFGNLRKVKSYSDISSADALHHLGRRSWNPALRGFSEGHQTRHQGLNRVKFQALHFLLRDRWSEASLLKPSLS